MLADFFHNKKENMIDWEIIAVKLFAQLTLNMRIYHIKFIAGLTVNVSAYQNKILLTLLLAKF